MVDGITSSLRLNIGAGGTQLEGFTPVDRKLGQEAYPLNYADDSVEEIRASHILEHFSWEDVPKVLADWVRVLRPGGRIRIAVPDFDKIAEDHSPLKLRYLMGGQEDGNDFHKSAFTAESLQTEMQRAGIDEIQRWESENTDCASLPISLNLEGVKGDAPAETHQDVKIKAIMSLPRYGSMSCRGIIEDALRPFGIPLETSQGVFWGQCMQRMMESALEDGVDWLLTIDFDSVFTAQQLSDLIHCLGQNEQIDAVCAAQSRREGETPLFGIKGTGDLRIDWTPIPVDTAHFGLTIFRVECLKDVEKPWFICRPDDKGGFGDHKMDADIHFWHQWKDAGKTIYCDPKVRIGHVEETVAVLDEKFKVQRMSITDWRQTFTKGKVRVGKTDKTSEALETGNGSGPAEGPRNLLDIAEESRAL